MPPEQSLHSEPDLEILKDGQLLAPKQSLRSNSALSPAMMTSDISSDFAFRCDPLQKPEQGPGVAKVDAESTITELVECRDVLDFSQLSEIKRFSKKAIFFKVGKQGGICCNEACGIALIVPEDAILDDAVVCLGLAKSQSAESPGFIPLSKEIICGCSETTFQKPVYLTFATNFVPKPDLHMWPDLFSNSTDGQGTWEKVENASVSMFRVVAELQHFTRFKVMQDTGEEDVRLMHVLCSVEKAEDTINGQVIVADSTLLKVRQITVRHLLLFPL